MRVLGVDPGLSGALCLLDGGELVVVTDMPVADGRVMAGVLADLIAEWRPAHAVIEQVRSRPGQGVASMFKFGRAYGCVEGVVEASRVPLSELTPRRWKQVVGVTADKASSRAEACRLWPAQRQSFARVKDDGRAEAALIARAWLITHGNTLLPTL